MAESRRGCGSADAGGAGASDGIAECENHGCSAGIDCITIDVVHALPQHYWSERLQLRSPATVADALAATQLPRRVPGVAVDPALLAVHGQPVRPNTPLHDGDRLEILRPLQCDPKEVRRRRADGASGRGRKRGAKS